MTNPLKEKVILTSKARLVKPSDEEYKAVAAGIKDRHGIKIPPQIDLLYVESCLVTAGEQKGLNDNDDFFDREQTWAARHTPLIKPANWQHQDKDILGVVYSVQARDLDGNILDFDSDEAPECEFELWTEAAVFKLIHPEKSREIESRASAGSLYVSMEAWFDSYDYAMFDASGKLDKLVARNTDTAFLDDHLRAKGGSGKYENKRIARSLANITFGGFGFVDNPANKRSVISGVGEISASEDDKVKILLEEALDRMENKQEVAVMATQGNSNQEPTKNVADEVLSRLEAKENEKARAEKERALAEKAEKAEARNRELEAKNTELASALEDAEKATEAFISQASELDNVVEAIAGATGDTPPEIASIDATSDGEGAFRAKIAWIQNSVASLLTKASLADSYEEKLAEAARNLRAQEVQTMLAEASVTDEDIVDAYVSYASDLSDEDFEAWKAQADLLILSVTQGMEHGGEMPFDNKKMKDKKMMKKEEKSKSSEIFERLAKDLRSRGEEQLINSPHKGDISSGVNSGSLRTPRHKIAGSVTDDPSSTLDNVEGEDGVNLAGASQAEGETDEVRESFHSLANLITGNNGSKDNTKSKAPGFDPVDE